jgi:hypothetical protein
MIYAQPIAISLAGSTKSGGLSDEFSHPYGLVNEFVRTPHVTA